MNILLIAHPYLNLYKTIQNELTNEGHKVTFISDIKLSHDPHIKTLPLIIRILNYLIWYINKPCTKRWQSIYNNTNIFKTKYDLLFVIQGCSFDKKILDFLRKNNPNIKSVLYIWDSNKYYNFFRNSPYFDKVYSVDLEDVQRAQKDNIKFLPFFWPKSIESDDKQNIKYKISSIGTNHHNRYQIYKRVSKDLEYKNVPYFIKLIIKQKEKTTIIDRIRLFFYKLLNKKNNIDDLKLKTGKLKENFIQNYPIEIDEFCQIMLSSEAILDTDSNLQYATTPRLIWALAANKHIFTTNENIKNFPFYNEEYIHIISRHNPIIDLNLINTNGIKPSKSVENLRIDKWLKNFLE